VERSTHLSEPAALQTECAVVFIALARCALHAVIGRRYTNPPMQFRLGCVTMLIRKNIIFANQ
jgi:hypothetical protein